MTTSAPSAASFPLVSAAGIRMPRSRTLTPASGWYDVTLTPVPVRIGLIIQLFRLSTRVQVKGVPGVTGLLSGVRVVETGVLMTVDNLGRLLGDEGADVVKVESPQLGDYLRDIMVRFAPGWSAFHVMLNRNKRSVAIDAHRRRATGARAADRICRRLHHGQRRHHQPEARPGLRGGTAPEPWHRVLPGDRVRGRRAVRRGADARNDDGRARGLHPALETVGGITHQVAVQQRRGSLGVVVGPLHAAFGVATALVRRAKTGEGCYLDVSCADTVLAASWVDALPIFNPSQVDPTGPTSSPMESAKYQRYRDKGRQVRPVLRIEAKFWDHFSPTPWGSTSGPWGPPATG